MRTFYNWLADLDDRLQKLDERQIREIAEDWSSVTSNVVSLAIWHRGLRKRGVGEGATFAVTLIAWLLLRNNTKLTKMLALQQQAISELKKRQKITVQRKETDS